MQTLWQDLRFGARMLLKKPGFTVVAELTLALGIGANTAIFSVADKLLVRSLAVKDPSRLVLINSSASIRISSFKLFSYPDFTDYRAQNQVFSDLLAFRPTTLDFRMNDRIAHVSGEYVSGNYFIALGVRAARGRTFSAEEDRAPGTQPVVVVSDGFWRRKFGADPNFIGRTVTVNRVPLTVIGIAPPNFSGMPLEEPTEIWVPALMYSQLEQPNSVENRTAPFLLLMGRIREGVSQPQAEASLDALAQQIKSANTPPGAITKGMPNNSEHIKFEPGGRGLSGLRKRFSSSLKLLMAVAGLVLLIACANVAGLSLTRGIARRKEMAIRLALGAGRRRVASQVLVESLLTACVGGAAGLTLAPWLVALLVKTQPRLSAAQTLFGETVDLRRSRSRRSQQF
ncbi:MAG: ABC transporter permease [Chloracidobacterium sp.]|nr:ABC transporter permease [Chloracidobacterium sp.]